MFKNTKNSDKVDTEDVVKWFDIDCTVAGFEMLCNVKNVRRA
jgi:hypothetical protein